MDTGYRGDEIDAIDRQRLADHAEHSARRALGLRDAVNAATAAAGERGFFHAASRLAGIAGRADALLEELADLANEYDPRP